MKTIEMIKELKAIKIFVRDIGDLVFWIWAFVLLGICIFLLILGV